LEPIVSDRFLLFALLLILVLGSWFFRQPGFWLSQAAGFGGPAENDSAAVSFVSGSVISPLAGANKRENPSGDGFVSADGLVLGSSGAKIFNSSAGASSYFTLPSSGLNWGKLHYDNAIDIADLCGRPIKAAAEGLVIEEFSNNRWNNGYGNYVLIEHPNGIKTRYAHTLKNSVQAGDYVSQGQLIALIGNTGNAKGATGCHLHFEVIGAKNPFAAK